MPTLASELRNKLERVVIDARDAAEIGARAALEALAVHHHAAYPHMKPAQIELRNHLRARALQLGDRKLPKPDTRGKDLNIDHLTDECAYEHWHRMLFARFLAENNLLIEPQEKMAISLSEAEELAKEDGVNVWVFASRCAQGMLPQIFRPDDPLLQVTFAAEHMLKLEKLLASLSQTVFTASDALGWVYQFWQSKKKDEVNRSEVKIGADEIAAVTQLFTEPYMVEFLLHNTLGAWWAGKTLTVNDTADAKTEDELRRKLALSGVGWEYLRFTRGADGKSEPWRPAAGTFEGWPKTAAELKVLDPCCGSGHFLVGALHHLTPIRMTEESLNAKEAVDAVLRENLHGLEIDERCCQIAAFALAFAAWTYPNAGGYRDLPDLQIACTGIAPRASKEEWLKLGEEIAAKGGMPAKRSLFGADDSLLSAPIKRTLEALHELFSQAPVLGSLIAPAKLRADLFQAEYMTVAPLLSAVLGAQSTTDEIRERAIAAAGMIKAADLLAEEYTLVVTNVPFKETKQLVPSLQEHLGKYFTAGKVNLATSFLLRITELLAKNGTAGVVTPHEWLFLKTYTPTRKELLTKTTWNALADIGEHGFASSQAGGAFTALIILSQLQPTVPSVYAGWDVTREKTPAAKALALLTETAKLAPQLDQLRNPDARIGFSSVSDLPLLSKFAGSFVGLQNGDTPRFVNYFWEFPSRMAGWEYFQLPVDTAQPFGGREGLLRWEDGRGSLASSGQARVQGTEAWGKRGVAIRQTRSLPATIYEGQLYDQSSAAIIPTDQDNLAALWAYCSSPEFHDDVRKLDKKKNVTNATLVKVPFDLERWKRHAEEIYPDGLPEPESSDPTQWLFHGRPEESPFPLQCAVARLLGYRWPAETDENMLLSKRARARVKQCEDLARFADDEGIVCIPSVRGTEPAAERLEALLTAAGLKPDKVRDLTRGVDLENWLRNSFFEEHCKLFYDRPFVWHVWDGRKHDGFHALINYHKLCTGSGKGRKLLESLTFAYLGDWITRQKDGVRRGEGGADDRLAAAVELQNRLKLILEGEPPFDLFARWKPLSEQPIGWEPDINDGVRINIRPFLASDLPAGRTGAGVLRFKPKVDDVRDRGEEPEAKRTDYPWLWDRERFIGKRINDCHITIAEKNLARSESKKEGR